MLVSALDENAAACRSMLRCLVSSFGPLAMSKAIGIPYTSFAVSTTSTLSSGFGLPMFAVARGGAELLSLLATSSRHSSIAAISALVRSIREAQSHDNDVEEDRQWYDDQDEDGATAAAILACSLVDVISSNAVTPRIPFIIAASSSFNGSSLGTTFVRNPRSIVHGYLWASEGCSRWLQDHLTMTVERAADLLHSRKRRMVGAFDKERLVDSRSNGTESVCRHCRTAVLKSVAMTAASVWSSSVGGRSAVHAIANAALTATQVCLAYKQTQHANKKDCDKRWSLQGLTVVKAIGDPSETAAFEGVVILSPSSVAVAIPKQSQFTVWLVSGDVTLSDCTNDQSRNSAYAEESAGLEGRGTSACRLLECLSRVSSLPDIVMVSGMVAPDVVRTASRCQRSFKSSLGNSESRSASVAIVGGIGSSALAALAHIAGVKPCAVEDISSDMNIQECYGRVGELHYSMLSGRMTLLVHELSKENGSSDASTTNDVGQICSVVVYGPSIPALRTTVRCLLATIKAVKDATSSGIVVGGGACELALAAQLEVVSVKCGQALPAWENSPHRRTHESSDCVAGVIEVARSLYASPRALAYHLGSRGDDSILAAAVSSCRWAMKRGDGGGHDWWCRSDGELWPVAGLSLDVFADRTEGVDVDHVCYDPFFLAADSVSSSDHFATDKTHHYRDLWQCATEVPWLVLDVAKVKQRSILLALRAASSMINVRAIMSMR